MNSNRNDPRHAHQRDAEREERFSYPEAGYSSGYGTSESGYRESGNRNSPGNPYGRRGDEHSDYGAGSSRHSGHGRDYRRYDQEDEARHSRMDRRSEYPETYRSAMSGYSSEHVGDDKGRRDYNPNPGEGNLYGNRYGRQQGDYERSPQSGYMSDDDYDRGSPFYSENVGYPRSGSVRHAEGRHKGKGPRNYRRADDRIQEDINDRLTDDSGVDASEIDVSVKNGEVTLSGIVDDRAAKRRAEDIAESVSGVTHLENRIRVRSAANPPPPIVTPF